MAIRSVLQYKTLFDTGVAALPTALSGAGLLVSKMVYDENLSRVHK
jgi:hypothetical protein